MPRWTIRNVDASTIRLVQELAGASGASLGEVLSMVVSAGAAAAQEQLQNRAAPTDILADLERIIELQLSMRQCALRLAKMIARFKGSIPERC